MKNNAVDFARKNKILDDGTIKLELSSYSGFLIDKEKGSVSIRVPYNVDIEKEVLGSILWDNNNMNIVTDILKSQFFYDKIHAEMYDIGVKLIDKGRVADKQSTATHLLSSGFFDNEQNPAEIVSDFINEIFSKYTIGLSNIKDRAEDIRDFYFRREIIRITQNTSADAFSNFDIDVKPANFIEDIEDGLFKLSSGLAGNLSSGNFKSLQASLKDVKAQIIKARASGGISGVSTGFYELDKMIHGWQSSDLVIVAGRPSMGKTSFAISVAINAAKNMLDDIKNGKSKDIAGCVGVFSLEMGADQLTTRIVSVLSGIDTHCIVGGTVDDHQLQNIVNTMQDIEDMPIFIDETPAINISQIRTRARRLKRRFGLKLLIVDYLQLIRASNHSENRVQEISAITQGLKAIAKELGIPIIALSQLSRNVESREDKRPQLSDLRESGSIEQDADIVMFLYRDSYYIERTRPAGDEAKEAEWRAKNEERLLKIKNTAEIMIAKHRNGPIGTVMLYFDEETTKFDNLNKVKS